MEYYKILMEFTANDEYYKFDNIKINKDQIIKNEKIISGLENYEMMIYNLYPMINLKMKRDKYHYNEWKLRNGYYKESKYKVLLCDTDYKSYKYKKYLQIFMECGLENIVLENIDIIMTKSDKYLTLEFLRFMIDRYGITEEEIRNKKVNIENYGWNKSKIELLNILISNYEYEMYELMLLYEYIKENKKNEDKILEYVKGIKNKIINKSDNEGYTILILACLFGIERVAME
jgi:hypothetical protein